MATDPVNYLKQGPATYGKRATRAVSAALHTPQLGGTLSQGVQNSVLLPLSPRESFDTPN